jgi:hypothetical protein
VVVIPPEVRVIKPGLEAPLTNVQRLFVVAFDEGVTTGWFVGRVEIAALVAGGLRGAALGSVDPSRWAWNAGSFRGPEMWQAELMMALVRGTWMYGDGEFDLGDQSDMFVVVGEAYKSRMIGDDATVLSPVRVQSMFRQLSWRAPFPFVLANIVDAMKVFTDHRLQMYHLWSGPAGKAGEHQRDATRYGALIMRNLARESELAVMEKRMPWMSSVKDDHGNIEKDKN